MIDGSTKTGETPAAREFRAGVQAQLQGRHGRGAREFEAALKIDPNYVPALIGLAGVAQAQGNTAQVEQYLQRAEHANPRSPDVHVGMGSLLPAQQPGRPSREGFPEGARTGPQGDPAAARTRRPLHPHAGRANDAARMYRAAVELDRNNAFAQYGLGVALPRRPVSVTRRSRRSRRPRSCSRRIRRALRAIGRLYLESGDLDKALAAFDRGLARQPQFVPVMLDRGEVLARMNRTWRRHRADVGRRKAGPELGRGAGANGGCLSACEAVSEAEEAYLQGHLARRRRTRWPTTTWRG